MESTDAARGRHLIERWCVLAEERLDYLTELFESGRWRIYFGEAAFLDNVQEAKRAVETWRKLATAQATSDNRPIDLSWLGRRSTLAPRRVSFLTEGVQARPGGLPAPAAVQPSARKRAAPSVIVAPSPRPAEIAATPPSEIAPPIAAAPADDDFIWQSALDVARMRERYPLLRNAI